MFGVEVSDRIDVTTVSGILELIARFSIACLDDNAADSKHQSLAKAFLRPQLVLWLC